MANHINLLIFLLFATGYDTAVGEECSRSGRHEEKMTVLKRDLFCNYDKLGRPTLNYTEPTNVRVHLWLNSIDIHEASHGNSAEIHSIVKWSWYDEFMKWIPDIYEHIDFFYIDSGSLWIPEVVLQNPTHSQSMSSVLRNGRCVVQSAGLVICLIPSVFHTLCVADNSRWPFDMHTCSLTLTALNDAGDNYVNLSLHYGEYSLKEYFSNREWQLLNVTVNRTTESVVLGDLYTSLQFKFFLRRHSALHTATILVSVFVLSLMTAASFCIDPESPVRVSFCCMNVFVQCLYLQHLQFSIGSNGDFCPRIVLFYRDSLLLAGLSLVIAVLVLTLSSSSSLPPGWSSGVVQWLLEYRLAQALLTGDINKVSTTQKPDNEERANVIDNSEDISVLTYPTNKWRFLVGILDRIMFYVFLIVFFILLIVRVS